METYQIVILVAAFVGQAIASYVVGTRKGHRKAVIEGAPSAFGESFLRRAEAHFKAGHDHAQMLTSHELKITAITATIQRIEAQNVLSQSQVTLELKELREMGAKIREDIASLRGAIGVERRRVDRDAT